MDTPQAKIDMKVSEVKVTQPRPWFDTGFWIALTILLIFFWHEKGGTSLHQALVHWLMNH